MRYGRDAPWRQVGLEGEDLEKERKRRQEKQLERLRGDQTPQDYPERPEIMFEGLESTWHVLGRKGNNILGTAPYRYAGEVQDYDRWKAQTTVYVTTMIYHRLDTGAKEAYRKAMKEVIEALQGAALQVVKEMKTADLMKYLQRDDGVVSTGLNDLILQMEHQIQGNDFT